MAQKITLADVVRCGREYLDARKLTAQKSYKDGQGALGCVYSDGIDGRCIIGSAMSDETIAELIDRHKMDERLCALVGFGNVIYVSTDDFDTMQQLQDLHDGWTQRDSVITNRVVMGKRFPNDEAGMRAALDHVAKKIGM